MAKGMCMERWCTHKGMQLWKTERCNYGQGGVAMEKWVQACEACSQSTSCM